MIIFLAWFHNSFHGICATLGETGSNKLFWSITQQTFLSKSFFSLPHLYRGLTHFRLSYLNLWFMLFFRNNFSRWKTSTTGIYNFIPSFSHLRICGSKWKNIFLILRKKSQSFMLLINRSLNYTQFNYLNGIENPSWSFMTVQQALARRIKITQFVWFMHRIILCGSMIFNFM